MTSPTRDLIAEASAWFVEFRSGEVVAHTRARFDEWLRRSPEHIQAYLEVSAAWSELPTADPEGRIDVASLVARARASAEDNVVGIRNPRAQPAATPQSLSITPTTPLVPVVAACRRLKARHFATAASLAFLVAFVGLGAWFVLFVNTYSTGIGEQRTVRLGDGSTIELNALSKVRTRLSRDRRDVELVRGQALFQVVKDRARPFIVASGATTVRAVGTQFDVYRKDSGTTVTVLEGEVSVLPAQSTPRAHDLASTAAGAAVPENARPALAAILLSAGEQVTVASDQVVKRKKADTSAATAWVQQRLIFEATPLAEVADEFNRYNPKKLVIADSELRALGISGVYSSSDPASLIGFLRAQPSLQVTETDSEIRVTRRGTH